MWRYIYGTTRGREYRSNMKLEDISLNGGYTTEFFNKGQFKDYEEAGITKLSMPIPNNRFTNTLPVIDENEQPTGETVPKLTRFVMLKYSDLYTNADDLTKSITSSSSDTAVDIFATNAEATQWVRDNTDLVETTPGVFEISPEHTDFYGNIVAQKVIDFNI